MARLGLPGEADERGEAAGRDPGRVRAVGRGNELAGLREFVVPGESLQVLRGELRSVVLVELGQLVLSVPVATLLLLTVGNSGSGATTGVVLLPGLARIVSGLPSPGAAVRAVADLSYFGGAHVAGPLITLALWAVLAALLVGLHSRQVATRG